MAGGIFFGVLGFVFGLVMYRGRGRQFTTLGLPERLAGALLMGAGVLLIILTVTQNS